VLTPENLPRSSARDKPVECLLPAHGGVEWGVLVGRTDTSSSPVRFASVAPNPTNMPNRCSLKPLTPETPEETLLLVLPQQRLTLQVVCRSLSRFQLPKPSACAR
jgi:hypothetical protein